MTGSVQAAVRRHEYHLLPIVDVVEETGGARSIVLEVPRHLKEVFRYRPGQFLTVRLRLGLDRHIRCYSMSSSPVTDETLRITVKRVEGGLVSNWINNTLKPGYKVEAMPPAGDFVLDDGPDDRPIVALCSGSGITPVVSIVKAALASTGRSVRLFFANQSRDAVIFGRELDELAAASPGRLEVVHHLYDEEGYVDPETVLGFLGDDDGADVYVCGSRRFSAAVDEALARSGVPAERIRHERFTVDASLDAEDAGLTGGPDKATVIASSRTEKVVVGIRGTAHALEYVPGQTVLQLARRANLTPPFACESGICAACMAVVTSGEVVMPGHNRTLTADELEAGWVLTCQGIPVSPTVELEYPS